MLNMKILSATRTPLARPISMAVRIRYSWACGTRSAPRTVQAPQKACPKPSRIRFRSVEGSQSESGPGTGDADPDPNRHLAVPGLVGIRTGRCLAPRRPRRGLTAKHPGGYIALCEPGSAEAIRIRTKQFKNRSKSDLRKPRQTEPGAWARP